MMNNGLMNGPGQMPMPPPGAMNGRGGPPPSPPISIARSSNGTGLYPTPNSEGSRKYSAHALEQQLQEHHRVLRDYLNASAREDHTYQPHNRARDKLLRLSPIQFQELSTDVYDELLRREDHRAAQAPNGPDLKVPQFLLPKHNFHPKRNQARQKLSTLAVKKFRELATDVLFELERRFPRFAGKDRFGGPTMRGPSRGPPSRPGTSHGMYPPPVGQMAHGMRRPSNASASSVGGYSPGVFENGRSMPKPGSLHSNTMVPNKGTMVEDDDDHSIDDDYPYDLERATTRSSRRNTNRSFASSVRENNPESQAHISNLEQKVDELENQLRQRDSDFESERKRSSAAASDLERRLASAESLNTTLQREIDSLRLSKENDDWRERYETLEQDFHEHRQVTEEVRHEATQSLQEMRNLSQKVQERSQNEETLTKQVAELESSVEDWRSRHAKAKAQLRNLQASSMALYIEQPTATQFAQQAGFLDARGLIRDVSVTQFQIAVEELLQLSRSSEPAQVLPYMRNMVSSVRAITADIDLSGLKLPEDVMKRREKSKARVSAATNNLITTAKNHATSNGLAPVSLIDAAASHLTVAVVELIKDVKVRPTSVTELDDGANGYH